MKKELLSIMQKSVQDSSAFDKLFDYKKISHAFLQYLQTDKPTRIISPTNTNYIFFQFSKGYGHRITRPLNTDLYIENKRNFDEAFDRLIDFLGDIKQSREKTIKMKKYRSFINSNELCKVIYTAQQSVGCIGDSFLNPNQSRKRVGQLFENFIKLIIQNIGFNCESRRISLPVSGHPDIKMSYELDLVISDNKAIITSEIEGIHPSEIVGSVKTTSKDRIDKVFLDKFLLSRLIGRDIPVIAVFLHDVQRAKKANSIFGINSTFKSNHFLFYTVALNRLDGVYYIDPRPIMTSGQRLSDYISNFQNLLTKDIWDLTK
jgi:hypothetical protein